MFDGFPCDARDSVACSERDSCRAGTCISGGGGDPDGDRICSLDDNCSVDPNPDQADIDGDGAGNVCDPRDARLVLQRLQLQHSTNSARPNGSVQARGEFVARDSLDPFDIAQGIAIQIRDSLSLDSTFVLAPTDCSVTQSGRISCRRRGRPSIQLTLQPLPSSIFGVRLYSLRLRVSSAQLEAPFQPVIRLDLADSPGHPVRGIDRVGQTLNCTSSRSGILCVGPYGSPSNAFIAAPSQDLLD